ncbi:37425_t:CDS:1, partial [Gigaspora margarita]
SCIKKSQTGLDEDLIKIHQAHINNPSMQHYFSNEIQAQDPERKIRSNKYRPRPRQKKKKEGELYQAYFEEHTNKTIPRP